MSAVLSQEEIDVLLSEINTHKKQRREMCDETKQEKWCWVKFIKGWINHKFLAFVITTVIVTIMIFKKELALASNERIVIFIIWGVVTVVFILGRAIDNAIYNAHIAAEFKAGAQLNVNTDTAKVIEAVKNINGGKSE